MAQSQPLIGKTAIVTGASSGIGRAISIHLSQAGAHVFLTGRNEASLAEAARLRRGGGKATPVTGTFAIPNRCKLSSTAR